MPDEVWCRQHTGVFNAQEIDRHLARDQQFLFAFGSDWNVRHALHLSTWYVAYALVRAASRLVSTPSVGANFGAKPAARSVATRHARVRTPRYNASMHDLRFALRTFLNTPGPILLAILAIALGIGANTAIFSVVRAVLLKPPPYAAPDRLVALFEADTAAGPPRVATSLANYEGWRDQT